MIFLTSGKSPEMLYYGGEMFGTAKTKTNKVKGL